MPTHDAAGRFGGRDEEGRKPVFDMMSPNQQHKMRKLLQYHPSTAGGMMSPDYVWVERGSTVDMALEAMRIDDKTPHQLLGTVFVTELDGKYAGSGGVVDLLRADRSRKVDELDLTSCAAHGNA